MAARPLQSGAKITEQSDMNNIEVCVRTMLDYTARQSKRAGDVGERHVTSYYQAAQASATTDIERRKVCGARFGGGGGGALRVRRGLGRGPGAFRGLYFPPLGVVIARALTPRVLLLLARRWSCCTA